MKMQTSSVSLLLLLVGLACAVAAFGPVARWLEARHTVHTVARAPVSLQAQIEGESLRIVWDRNAAVLRRASGGSVTIEDGSLVRRIPLTADQLRTSNGIVYVPQSALVKAELQVDNAERKNAAPSVVVVVSPPRSTAVTAATPALTPSTPVAAAQPAPAPLVRGNRTEMRVNQIAPARPQPVPVRLLETAALKQRSGEGIRDYRPPAPTYAAKPNLPTALAQLVAGTVEIDVQVKISARGEVTAAMPVSQTGSLRGSSQERALVAHAVLEAARKWTFAPARIGAQAVPSEVVVSFRLSNG